MSILEDKIRAAAIARPSYTFTLPPGDTKLSWDRDPKTFTIVQYTIGEELDATKAAETGAASFRYELLRRTVTHLDGKPVDDTEWIEKVSPPVRLRMLQALDRINYPAAKDDVFFDSVVASPAGP